MLLPDDVCATVWRVSAPYLNAPVPDAATFGRLLNAIAWAHRGDGWGLSAKPGGKNVPSPQGVLVAEDILHHRPSGLLFDIWTGADVNRPLSPACGGTIGPPQSADRVWVAPVQPTPTPVPPGPTPVPPQPPAPPAPTVCSAAQDVATLKAQMASIVELLQIVVSGQAALGGDLRGLEVAVGRLAEGIGDPPHHLLGHLVDIKSRVTDGVPAEPFR
jgi:hypothetical protein